MIHTQKNIIIFFSLRKSLTNATLAVCPYAVLVHTVQGGKATESEVRDDCCDLKLVTVLCCAYVRCRTSVNRGSKEANVSNCAMSNTAFINSAFIQKEPFVLRLSVLISLDAKAPL